MRSIRNWSYATFKNSRIIIFVCIATPEDIKANAEFIKMADKLVLVPGGSNVNNYANVDLIVRIAEQYSVDAVWPGWGHASENSSLPENLFKNEIAFLGPQSLPMWALGDKIASTILAQTVNVPTLAWSGSGIIAPLDNKGKIDMKNIIDMSLYRNACIHDESVCIEKAQKIGFPLMIKASEGGGGKGIRRADKVEDISSLYNQVVHEVPGSPIFLMKCLDDVRHVEVQLLSDEYGNSISLFGRDCSVQRRHQKILEEAPVVIVPRKIFEEMEKAAVRLAKLVGYSSAGTVEYLYDVKSEQFFFLELNPRLQVEHPCTEVITNINIPACQLEIAMGIPLHRIREIRSFYQKPIYTQEPIDFSVDQRRQPNCHVIAVRITSEDPDEGFKPIPGDVEEINFKSSRSVWGYFSVGSIGGIHEFADSQFGHCFSASDSRESARENMVIALKELSIRGGFRTTVEYLIKILESNTYENNLINTKWLDMLIAGKDRPDKPNTLLGVVCTSLHIADKHFEKSFNFHKVHLEKGQLLPANSNFNSTEVVLISEDTKYTIMVVKMGKSFYNIICNGSINEFEVHHMKGGGLIISFQDASYMTYCQEDATSYRIMIDNRTCRFSKETDVSVIRSPSSGKLIQYTIDDGQMVLKNQVVAIIEVMKLILELRSPANGIIRHLANQGAVLQSGLIIARLELEDPSQKNDWKLFNGNFDQLIQEISVKNNCKYIDYIDRKRKNSKINMDFFKSLETCQSILAGYLLPEPYFNSWLDKNFKDLIASLSNSRLPAIEFEVTLKDLENRLPARLVDKLKVLNKLYSSQATSVLSKFPSDAILDILNEHLDLMRSQNNNQGQSNNTSPGGNPSTDLNVKNFLENIERILLLASKYQNGLKGFAVHVISSLLVNYASVESHFNCTHYDRAVHNLISIINDKDQKTGADNPSNRSGRLRYLTREEIWSQIDKSLSTNTRPRIIEDIIQLIMSHNQVSSKNKMINKVIYLLNNRTDICPLTELIPVFRKLTELGKKEYSSVALASRQILIKIQTPTYEMRRNQVESMFLSAIRGEGQDILESLITTETLLFDILNEFLYHPDDLVVAAALEVYVRRAYIAYTMNSVAHNKFSNGTSYVQFSFVLPKPFHYEESLTACMNSMGQFHKSSSSNQISLLDLERKQGLPSVHSERIGAMAAFKSLNAAEECIGELLETFRQENERINAESLQSNTHTDGLRKVIYSYTEFNNLEAKLESVTTEMDKPKFKHILNIGFLQNDHDEMRVPMDGDGPPTGLKNKGHNRSFSTGTTMSNCDENNVAVLEEFLAKFASDFRRLGISRVTFMIAKMRFFAKYYTFRSKDNFKEDKVFRHLEPALAFQLEINRLKNYTLERIPVVNRRMNLYFAKARNALNKEIYDYRFFVRSIIRHANLLSNNSSFEYLQSEAQRVLLESMDAMEAAFTHPFANQTTGNHIFMNFAPSMYLDEISELEETVRQVVQRYGLRLWRLRITQAELRFMIRFKDAEQSVPIRFFLNNEQGYSLNIDTYQEVANPIDGIVYFQAFDKSRGEKNFNKHPHPLHGMQVDTPYKTKDYIQLKRSNALKFNTPYAYDYPLLFEQALEDLWNEFHCIEKDDNKFENNNNPKVSKKKRFRKLTLQQIESKMLACELNQKKRSVVVFEADSSSNLNDRPTSNLIDNDEGNGTKVDVSAMNSDNKKCASGGFISECTELALDKNGCLIPVDRLPGINDIGMVAWFMVIKTPDCPDGRSVVLIANDVTIKAGSFGPAEDLLFSRASQLARRLGIPRIYIASNSGARIKLAEEVKSAFKIEWKNPEAPEKGFKYIYLDKKDYQLLSREKCVLCQPIEEADGRVEKYKITAIIGRDNDMSVENLRGSAMIASETSLAYDECFTISIVSSRTIGIGAYLVRLGQRVVQVDNSHIILTGVMALNKLLGRNVYTNNSQLGGIQIMALNGITHFVASNELKAIKIALKTMTYVSPRKGMRKLTLFTSIPKGVVSEQREHYDPYDRNIGYVPTKERPNDDPRWMITGVYRNDLLVLSPDAKVSDSEGNVWLSGFFDYNSFQESLSGWANTVITGRARLGGISVGIIVPESRSVVCKVPADPANLDSEAVNISQAGQVWFPDSSFKTAQAVSDFNREELPLIIFANWRGFSGGLKDMYDQVLKFGAQIVDSLRVYTQPIFVYIPPQAEVRGGAWVVIDSSINPDHMEIYCDPTTSRASVLEPEGVAEIKYRMADLIKTIMRNDQVCQDLANEIKKKKSLYSEIPNSMVKAVAKHQVEDEIKELNSKLDNRIKFLTPFYEQVSRNFVDLHDTPQRLEYRNLVHKLVPWQEARRFFYLRLRNNILLHESIKIISKTIENSSSIDETGLDSCKLENNIFCRSFSESIVEDEVKTETTNLVEQPLNLLNFISNNPNELDKNEALPTATSIANICPQHAIKMSCTFRKVYSILRKWFTEDLKTYPNYSGNTKDELECIWDKDEKVTGDWLAYNLNYRQLLAVPSRESTNEFIRNEKTTFIQSKINEKRCDSVIFKIHKLINNNKDILPQKFLDFL